ncbi:MAG: arsenic resistance protein [Microbacterium sp. 14-71-5]|uniref:arsenic resistance protein n=1 Tax=Microbacterium sp. 13-71-7 TaxID=1970399 RepID=UPI000BCED7F3|nr:arsenic resistance protein [Microbacterium sp. 13-71-7]OZB84818.1 MAG: arsenic resistance protein [Microbacterium sp. 13-71-7]OZB88160.1 MAG: arsenic resistance protein [Microbacterium sp. 14-71-5]
MERITAWAERHQVVLYLAAIALGALVGILTPSGGAALRPLAMPVLGVLLYATFLGVPFRSIAASLRDLRFLGTVLVADFVVVPLVVFGLSRLVAHDRALLIGVLLVLLTPCVDYVIVFTGLAGGAKDRLLAATPLLMLGQMLLLPAFLRLFAGPDAAAAIEPAPFAEAFLLLVLLPLAAAALTQLAATRFLAARVLRGAMLSAMVPLMMLTLALVVAGHAGSVVGGLPPLLGAAGVYVLFAAIALGAGAAAGRIARLDVPARRAVAFSAVTRNSLVVLPLALALPPGLSLAAPAVVLQTLVELLVMVAMVRLVPRMIR